MQIIPTILASRRLAFGKAEIVEWRWPSPLDLTVRANRHMIEISLPPLATTGAASFPKIGAARPAPIGNIFVRPAGVAIRSYSPGVRIRAARPAVDPLAFTEIAGSPLWLDGTGLRAALDLRSGRLRTLLELLRDELAGPGLGAQALIEAYSLALVVETARALAPDHRARHSRTGRSARSRSGCARSCRRRRSANWRDCAGSACVISPAYFVIMPAKALPRVSRAIVRNTRAGYWPIPIVPSRLWRRGLVSSGPPAFPPRSARRSA